MLPCAGRDADTTGERAAVGLRWAEQDRRGLRWANDKEEDARPLRAVETQTKRSKAGPE